MDLWVIRSQMIVVVVVVVMILTQSWKAERCGARNMCQVDLPPFDYYALPTREYLGEEIEHGRTPKMFRPVPYVTGEGALRVEHFVQRPRNLQRNSCYSFVEKQKL